MLCPPSTGSLLFNLPPAVYFTVALLLGTTGCLPGNAYAQPRSADQPSAAVCIVNPMPPSPTFSGAPRSTSQPTWICDARSDLYTDSASPTPFGEQRIDGVAYTMVGLLGMSGSVLLVAGGIFTVQSDTPINSIGVPMIVAGAFAGGAGIWSFVKGMRILFADRPE